MEVRCPACNKLFRVSDDKIQGSGVRFKCTRCGNSVKITQEDFEQYLSSKKEAPAAAPAVPGQAAALSPVSQKQTAPIPPKLPEADLFDMSSPAEAAVAMQESAALEEPVFAQTAAEPSAGPDFLTSEPEAKPALKPERREEKRPPEAASRPAAKQNPEAAVSPKQENESARAGSPSPAQPVREARPASLVIGAAAPQSPASSGPGRKVAILVIGAAIVIGSAVAGVKYYPELFSLYSGRQQQTVRNKIISTEGLQIMKPVGAIDAATQDLVISGTVVNTTDKPKTGWYVLAEVYDAQGAVLVRSKMVNGKQFYTRRDYEIMAKRGENIQDIKAQRLQEPGISIPSGSSVNFEIRVIEPPAGIFSFNATLQPFDPVQLYKEMTEEQK